MLGLLRILLSLRIYLLRRECRPQRTDLWGVLPAHLHILPFLCVRDQRNGPVIASVTGIEWEDLRARGPVDWGLFLWVKGAHK